MEASNFSMSQLETLKLTPGTAVSTELMLASFASNGRHFGYTCDSSADRVVGLSPYRKYVCITVCLLFEKKKTLDSVVAF